ncbi:MAG: UDP-N-acetylmuramate dehydrogenase [Candidatus Sedimenticola endophacoides]
MAERTVKPRGELLIDEPMSRHTTWRVGGAAKRFYRPADSADLAGFLRQLPPEEPVLWLGLGSNLLVRVGGFNGTVIATQGRLEALVQVGAREIRAESGVACAKVARFAARSGLCGVEFLAGIPGTMGGALAMNSGAFGSETWDYVTRVETIDRSGTVRERQPGDFEIGYRRVRGVEGEWFLSCHLRLKVGDVAAAQRHIRELLERRTASQPTGMPSCGSVFRNPEGDYAARLIEAAGLKGLRLGGACVSEKHANFILNEGGASAADIEGLMERVRAEVERSSGIRLEHEVRVVGEAEL